MFGTLKVTYVCLHFSWHWKIMNHGVHHTILQTEYFQYQDQGLDCGLAVYSTRAHFSILFHILYTLLNAYKCKTC